MWCSLLANQVHVCVPISGRSGEGEERSSAMDMDEDLTDDDVSGQLMDASRVVLEKYRGHGK